MSRKPANAGAKNKSVNDSVDAEEIAYFDDLADDWWDPAGPFAALQRMTPARVAYIRRHARRLLTTETGQPSTPLSGLTILDIGCGGGLLAEALQRLGASVTGIDAGAEAIAAARRHAAQPAGLILIIVLSLLNPSLMKGRCLTSSLHRK